MDVESDAETIALRDPEYARLFRAVSEARQNGARIRTPKIVKSAEPVYPKSMQKQWKEAVLHFAIIVDKTGKVRSVHYVPHPNLEADFEFVNAGEIALFQWTFEPARIADEIVEYPLIAPITFALR